MTLEAIAVILTVIVVLAGAILYTIRRGPNLADLTEAFNQLSRRVRELEAESTADRAQIRKMEKRVVGLVRIISMLSDGLHALTSQIIELGDLPRWTPPKEAANWLDGRPVVVDELEDPDGLAAATHQILWKSFSLEDLEQLCFDLGVGVDDFPKEHQARARAMVLHYKRRGRLSVLVEEIRRRRPHVPWPPVIWEEGE